GPLVLDGVADSDAAALRIDIERDLELLQAPVGKWGANLDNLAAGELFVDAAAKDVIQTLVQHRDLHGEEIHAGHLPDLLRIAEQVVDEAGGVEAEESVEARGRVDAEGDCRRIGKIL